MMTASFEKHRLTTMRQQLHRESGAGQHLPHLQRCLALLLRHQRAGEGLPAGKRVCRNRIQQQNPVESLMTMNVSETSGHAAALAIAAAADQSSTPPVASQQPGATELPNTDNTISQLPMAVDQHRRHHQQLPQPSP